MPDKPKSTAAEQKQARAAYLRGDYAEAIGLQRRVVERHLRDGRIGGAARKLLALYLYSDEQIEQAVELLKALMEEDPSDPELPENIGVMLRSAGKLVEAVAYLLRAHELSPQKPNICDGLAHSFHRLGKLQESQHFGRLSLELKSAAVAENESWPVPNGAPPSFETKKRERNVISFSLFGDGERYLRGALRNARLAPDLYPAWTCRFYCDPRVPKAIVDELVELGCEVVMRSTPEKFYEGLLWRFLVIDDPAIDRFLIRDSDSVINIKERIAVDDWIASEKWFHAMRDYASHTELLLAGMWGGVSGVLPPLEELLRRYSPGTEPTRTFDQLFLREMVWPTVRKSVVIHDSVYTSCLSSIPFPPHGNLAPERHIGQNESAVVSEESGRTTDLGSHGRTGSDLHRFFVTGMKNGGLELARDLINLHPKLQCSPPQHLASLWRNSVRWGKSYEKILLQLGRCSRDFLNTGDLRAELYQTWLEHIFDQCELGEKEDDKHELGSGDRSATHLGICDGTIDERFEFHAEAYPNAKFVFVVRDPRDAAAAAYQWRKENEPGFGRGGEQSHAVLVKSTVDRWVKKMQRVREFYRNYPDRIELFRYEDLMSKEKRTSSLGRLFEFLGAPAEGKKVRNWIQEDDFRQLQSASTGEGGFCRGRRGGLWQDTLTSAQIVLIEKRAKKWMEKLKYQPAQIVERGDSSGDTILPS